VNVPTTQVGLTQLLAEVSERVQTFIASKPLEIDEPVPMQVGEEEYICNTGSVPVPPHIKAPELEAPRTVHIFG